MKPAPLEFSFLDVPIPPSTNRLYRNITRHDGKKGKALTKEHKAWRTMFLTRIATKKMPVFVGDWYVEVVLPRNFVGDPSNYVKSVEDALVKSARVPDDKRAEGSFGRRGDAYEGPGCMVIVRSLRRAEEAA